MPTVGWIREGDLDAFYEGTERTPDPSLPKGPTFSCPFCASVFTIQSEFHDHVYSQHRVERPLITLRGVEPTAHGFVRTALDISDIAIVNTSFAQVRIDGTRLRELSPGELKDLMTNSAQAEINLELVNAAEKNTAPVITRYKFSFRIADRNALKDVEKAFTEALVTSAISREAISRFLSDQRTQGLGRDYASGLADYCLGILLKERPEDERLTTPLSRYRELYGGALEVLKDIQRPLARLIASIISFSMNDFRLGERRTGYWELDLATAILLDPSSAAFPIEFTDADRRAVCPVDHGTGRMLELAIHLAAQPRWSPILEDECRGLAKSEFLDVSDHQKAFAIWAASAWRLDSKKSALEPLMQIAEVYPFSRWASKYLEQVST
ncbi:hypothetical protein N5A93_18670 [Roseovarius sp. EGI FJ00037]|uniref:hypothetical protein n=1 Tax=Roseovarius salincola TaxID=2978479 RepID=UPI0022A821AF|nr:hypothetical protein [Roseovarius sp. EGI FJ00037]MCZ0814245.1 hypothetical protein [Roseovarius sp. EGI FJ00037]